jgi:hypothetical protein
MRPTQGETARGISDKGYANLSKFVEGGGTLICFDGSCAAVIRQMKLPLRNVLAGVRSSDFYCPGSILRINVDTANPLARAMSKDTDAYFINSSAFETTDNKVQVVARYERTTCCVQAGCGVKTGLRTRSPWRKSQWAKAASSFSRFDRNIAGQTWGTFPFIWNAINLSSR